MKQTWVITMLRTHNHFCFLCLLLSVFHERDGTFQQISGDAKIFRIVLSLSYNLFNALFITLSTVASGSSRIILATTLSASFFANPSMTNADNDSFRVVLSAGIKI